MRGKLLLVILIGLAASCAWHMGLKDRFEQGDVQFTPFQTPAVTAPATTTRTKIPPLYGTGSKGQN